MANITAHMLIGSSPNLSEGFIPKYAAYLFEGGCAQWILAATALSPMLLADHSKIIWTLSSLDHVVDDGLLMVATVAEKNPAIVEAATKECMDPAAPTIYLDRVRPEGLKELRLLNRAAHYNIHCVVTILARSSLMREALTFREYSIGLEVCTWRYSRIESPKGFEPAYTDDHPFLNPPYPN